MKLWSWFVFPFFVVRLFLTISPTLLKFAFLPLRHRLHLVVAVFFVMVILTLHLLKTANKLPFLAPHTSPTPAVSSQDIDQQIEYWENLRQLQPTHRDILVNLAVLYQLQGNEIKAQDYLNQAKALDPNSPLFQNNSPE